MFICLALTYLKDSRYRISRFAFLFLHYVPKEAPLTAFTPNSAVAVATAQQVAYANVVSNDEVGAMLEKLATEVEVLLAAMVPAAPPPQHAILHSLLESIVLTRRSRDANAAMTLLKKVSKM